MTPFKKNNRKATQPRESLKCRPTYQHFLQKVDRTALNTNSANFYDFVANMQRTYINDM